MCKLFSSDVWSNSYFVFLAIEGYQDLLAESLAKFSDLSSKIGGLVKDQAELVSKVAQEQLELLQVAFKSKQPDSSQLPKLFAPISTLIKQITVYFLDIKL